MLPAGVAEEFADGGSAIDATTAMSAGESGAPRSLRDTLRRGTAWSLLGYGGVQALRFG